MRKYGKTKWNTHASLERFEASEGRCSSWFARLKKEFKVERKTKYQIRINDVLDFYPKNMRYHKLATNERGEINGIKDLRILL